MSRKDTIVLAVLVNCAILVALFVTAIKRDDAKDMSGSHSIAAVSSVQLPQTPKKEIGVAQGDEIDRVLKEFSEKNQKTQKQEQTVDFAKELKALTVASTPQPAAKTRAAKGANVLEVTVQKGDALEKIARKHGTSVHEIMTANGMKTTILRIGQVLKVPQKKQAVVQRAVSKSTSRQFYTVKPGDNPWTISVKNQIKVDELLRLNNLDDAKARKIKPGDQLRIR